MNANTVTPFSSKPYYPCLLGNGRDTVLLNFCGAMMTGMTGHTHAERHQGSVCAWYKQEHRHPGSRISPIIISGYQMVIDGEVCEATGYVQEFDCRSAVLKTLVSFRCGTNLKAESFLTDSGVLVYELELLATHAERVSAVFFVLAPGHVNGTFAPGCPQAEMTFASRPDGADFTYRFPNGSAGRGALDTDRTDGKIYDNGDWFSPGVSFEGLKPGWRGIMYTRCADLPEELPPLVPNLKEEHIAGWRRYFSVSDMHLPDPELQYASDLARYLMRASQHRSGAIACGMLPHMWGGGLCCPCDAEIIWLAMLMNNNTAEARRYLQFFLDRYEEGEQLAASLGLKGTAFSNWHSVLGEHLKSDLKRELLKNKPVMIAITGIAAGEYCLYGDEADEGAKKLLHGCADFIESGFIRNGKIVSTAAGNESCIEVERDSFMLAVAIRVLELDGQFNGIPERLHLAERMRQDLRAENLRLEGNRTVSLSVEKGEVTRLEISGRKPARIVLNPAYTIRPLADLSR